MTSINVSRALQWLAVGLLVFSALVSKDEFMRGACVIFLGVLAVSSRP